MPVTNQPGRHGDRRYRRDHYEYYPGISSLPDAVAPNLRNRSWQMTALVDNTNGDAQGVIANHGSTTGGYAIYVKDGRLTFADNFLGTTITTVQAEVELPRAATTVGARSPRRASSKVRSSSSTTAPRVGRGPIPRTTPLFYGIQGFEVGYQRGPSITPDYDAPFTFTPGALGKVTFDVEGRPQRDAAGEARVGMGTQ